MRLQSPPLRSKITSAWPVLNRIQKCLGIDDRKMADLVRLTEKEMVKMRAKERDISPRAAFYLADALNIGFEAIVTGRMDYIALAQQFLGNHSYIPERYLQGAHSKRRTVINILDYIKENLGGEQRWRTLQQFQMTESMFEDPDAPINLRFSVDICDMLLNRHRTHQTLFEIGQHSVRTNKNSEMGQSLQKARNVREVYEMMFSGISERYIENNFTWKIDSFSTEECLISGYPNEEIVNAIGKKYVYASSGMWIREGFIASIPEYIGMESAKIKRVRCVSRMDSKVTFLVNLELLIRSKNKKLVLVA